jgi:hypothetical protein
MFAEGAGYPSVARPGSQGESPNGRTSNGEIKMAAPEICHDDRVTAIGEKNDDQL